MRPNTCRVWGDCRNVSILARTHAATRRKLVDDGFRYMVRVGWYQHLFKDKKYATQTANEYATKLIDLREVR